MNPLLALAAVGAACWHAWIDFAMRVTSIEQALPLLLVAGALLVPFARSVERWRSVSLPTLTALLIIHATLAVAAQPIFSMAAASLAMAYCLWAATSTELPRFPFVGLVLLAMPVLPTLEFYAAYPVRLAAIEATATLLRMNGLSVGVEGLALRFNGQLLQFDAPCSGVRMLWTCWFLASALAYLHRLSWWRYALALLLASAMAVAGNILRATSLFQIESGLWSFRQWPWMHEAVGIAAFVLTAASLCISMHWLLQREPRSTPGVRA
jgi:exosortase/archaeosortase family protein